MKVIFSRKGFDSTAGGYPSPIVDGTPRSFPIPAGGGPGPRYRDLANGLGELLEQLTSIDAEKRCHLDPDLDAKSVPRAPGWRGAFGQVNAAQGHLRRQNVTDGDLFLFWGWFQSVQRVDGRWRYIGDSEHRIFGWLQVGNVLAIGNDPSSARAAYPWLADHPHLAVSDWPPSNTVYVSTLALTLDGGPDNVAGCGTFRTGLRLTAPDSPRSKWRVPNWLNQALGGTGLSRTRESRWAADGTLSVGPGQEFVADISGRDDAAAWLHQLFRADDCSTSPTLSPAMNEQADDCSDRCDARCASPPRGSLQT